MWALAVDESFTIFYSGGRDKKVYATELVEGVCVWYVYCSLPDVQSVSGLQMLPNC